MSNQGFQNTPADQQLQLHGQPQGTSGNSDQNYQQSETFTTENGHGTWSHSQQSWTGTLQAMVPTFSAPPAPTMTATAFPPMPGMLSANNFFQQGQRMFQSSIENSRHFVDRSMDLHARTLEQGQRTAQAQNLSMSMSMNNMFQQPMIQQQPPPVQQPQIISYIQNIYHHNAPQRGHPQQIGPPPQQMQIENNESNNRFQAIEQRRDTDVRELNQVGAMMNDRIRDIENQFRESQSSSRESSRFEHELQQLREENARMAQQQLDDNKGRQEEDRRRDEEYRRRRDEDRAEWRQSQVSSPQPPALDMDALRKVILETQSKQLSSEDVHRAVEQAVNQRLVGVATREDLVAANRSMQHRLSLEPRGASEEQVQRAFGTELNEIVASIQSQREHQRQIEAPRIPSKRVRTEYIIEEIEDEPTSAPAMPSSQFSRQQDLPPVSPSQASTPASQDMVRSSDGRKRESDSRSSRHGTSSGATAVPTYPVQPTATPSKPAALPISRQARALPAPSPAPAPADSRPLSRSKPAQRTETVSMPAEQALIRPKKRGAAQSRPASAPLPPTEAPDTTLARVKTAAIATAAPLPCSEMVRSRHGRTPEQSHPSQQLSQATSTRQQPAASAPKQLPATKTPRQLPAPPSTYGGQQPMEQNSMTRVPRQELSQGPPAPPKQAARPQRQLEGPSNMTTARMQEPDEQNQTARMWMQQASQTPP